MEGKFFMILLEKFNSGQKIKQSGGYFAFIPNKINDIWKWESSDVNFLLEKANLELGELNSYADLTISNILKSFIENEILIEKKNDNNLEIKRNKQYILKKYLDIFSKGIE